MISRRELTRQFRLSHDRNLCCPSIFISSQVTHTFFVGTTQEAGEQQHLMRKNSWNIFWQTRKKESANSITLWSHTAICMQNPSNKSTDIAVFDCKPPVSGGKGLSQRYFELLFFICGSVQNCCWDFALNSCRCVANSLTLGSSNCCCIKS